MVKAADNIITLEPLQDIRLAIGPAEALLRDDSIVEPEPEPVDSEAVLSEAEERGFDRGRNETIAEYEEKMQHLRHELQQAQQAQVGELLAKMEQGVHDQVQQRLQFLESELVEFSAEAAIRLVNNLPISTDILEASIGDALSHCENDLEVSDHLNPTDLKLLKESGSELLADSPHRRNIRFLKDDEIARGGCLVETRCGVIDGRRETREQLLRDTVNA